MPKRKSPEPYAIKRAVGDYHPGDVVISHLSALVRKPRPWVLLWVDDVDKVGLFVGLTTQVDHPSARRTEHPDFPYMAGFTSVSRLDSVGGPVVGHFNRHQRDHVAKTLYATLDLIENHTELEDI